MNQKIRGMTEKYVLREAVRDVITDTVYRRQKHPFLSPPATLNPEQTFNTYVQDTLRGSVMARFRISIRRGLLPCWTVGGMDAGARTAYDQILMPLVSMCVIHRDSEWSVEAGKSARGCILPTLCYSHFEALFFAFLLSP